MDFLNSFIDDGTDWWDSATHIDSKKGNKEALILLKGDIFSQYLLYERVISLHRDNPNIPSFMNEDNKKLLLDYYNNPPVMLKSKLQSRRNNNLNVCPYCGDLVRPNTLDHFIPKENFSHYAIFQNNLVPQCRTCASIKSSKYFEFSQGCLFIHPFYSDILSRVKYKITLSFDSSINLIEVEKVELESSNLTTTDKIRVKCHFKELKVKSRIEQYCLREFKELRRKAKQNSFPLDDWILGKLSINNDNGSDWCTAFYKSLNSCGEAKIFLNKLIEQASEKQSTLVPQNIEVFDFE